MLFHTSRFLRCALIDAALAHNVHCTSASVQAFGGSKVFSSHGASVQTKHARADNRRAEAVLKVQTAIAAARHRLEEKGLFCAAEKATETEIDHSTSKTDAQFEVMVSSLAGSVRTRMVGLSLHTPACAASAQTPPVVEAGPAAYPVFAAAEAARVEIAQAEVEAVQSKAVTDAVAAERREAGIQLRAAVAAAVEIAQGEAKVALAKAVATVQRDADLLCKAAVAAAARDACAAAVAAALKSAQAEAEVAQAKAVKKAVATVLRESDIQCKAAVAAAVSAAGLNRYRTGCVGGHNSPRSRLRILAIIIVMVLLAIISSPTQELSPRLQCRTTWPWHMGGCF
mmetsp:Transcript_48779/g.104113  ORF Transcript_48779/g.104113 Transcript_48779/m.104113 type:complete len:341 (-) Transcript_48779:44-1066(-)